VKVRDAMAKSVTSAKRTDKISDVAKKMKQEDSGFIPIVDGEVLVGVITDRDIVITCIAEGHDPRDETAEHLMNKRVTTVGPEDDLEEAGRKMERAEVRRLPVTENGKLVGVLSHGNLVQANKGKLAEKVTEGVTRGA
jgi:CBS domain-containing protein